MNILCMVNDRDIIDETLHKCIRQCMFTLNYICIMTYICNLNINFVILVEPA